MGFAYSEDEAPEGYRLITTGLVEKGDRLWIHNQGWLVLPPSAVGKPVSTFGKIARKVEVSDEPQKSAD